MKMDTTAIGIAFGIIGVIIFMISQFRRKQVFDVGNTVLIFLSFFAIPLSIDLLWVAILGDEKNLPNSWREYIAVAVIVGLGLSFKFIIRAFKSIRIKSSLSDQEQTSEEQNAKTKEEK